MFAVAETVTDWVVAGCVLGGVALGVACVLAALRDEVDDKGPPP